MMETAMTYDPKTDYKKVDFEKLKAFVKKYESTRQGYTDGDRKMQYGIMNMLIDAGAGAFSVPVSWVDAKGLAQARMRRPTSWATTIYAVVAHMHGKLCMTRIRVPTFGADGRHQVIDFTKEMQAQLVGTVWTKFLREEKPEHAREPVSEQVHAKVSVG